MVLYLKRIMKIKVYEHKGPKFTVKQMYKSAKFAGDIGNLKNLNFEDYYDVIRMIPYRSDPNIFEKREIVSRPLYSFNAGKLDCKKKGVLIGAYCNGQKPKIKFKFCISSERPDGVFHHVFPIVKLNGDWIIADATYQHYFLGKPKPGITKIKVL